MLIGKKSYWPYLAIAPAAFLLSLVFGLPVMQVLRTSISNTDNAGDVIGFNNFENYSKLFNDPMLSVISINTFIWTLGVLIPATIISLFIAILLDMNLPGRAIMRVIVFIPWAISFVFVSIIWRYSFDQVFGPLNSLFGLLLDKPVEVAWLATPSLAMISVIWVGITLTIPFTTLVLLAGLQSIPQEIVEAGWCDGASGSKLFYKIKFPFLKPVLVVATLVNLLAIFNSFPIIWTMTGGGPANSTDTFPTYLYRIAFTDYDFGKAGALSFLGLVVLVSMSIVYVKKSGTQETF
jgi:ABC-type sugar transport system permease subunit